MTHQQTRLDLDAYFARIGYGGPATPTLETLRTIVAGHAATIPFENLTPLLRQPVLLDSASLQRKLVREGRGGYCFEHNLLLSEVLTTLGFEVTNLAARVRWNIPDEVLRPRSHMVLLVAVEGQPYIADVGFGGLTMTGPLALVPELEQQTPHEPFRLRAAGDGDLLQALVGEAWQTLYSFDLQPQLLPDYEVTSWYLSNHPASQFVTTLIAARAEPGRRYALRNTQLAIHQLGAESERRTLATVAELRAALRDLFHIALPDTPELDVALGRILEL
jgi:N-hydroxyarylamine O-acetyltransferase